MGSVWKTIEGGLGSWSGTATAKIDLTSGGEQSALVAFVTGSTPQIVPNAVLQFQIQGTTRNFGGTALLKGIQITAQINNIITIKFDFTGSGPLTVAWS